ncbi:putative lipid II flippase FtsW [Patescibacteria group bacterium]|nr:putative lipid II flippase FtsW [Patescibacteria group bacterium]MBU4480988.1 putative lipid II flippase FtsW [Patescibacteria group bacterium]
MNKDKERPDYILFSVIVILIILGILILFSVSAFISQAKFGKTYYFLNHQLLFGLVPGLILAFLAFKIRLDFFKKWAFILLLINLVLMLLVFFPKIGVESGGAARWLGLGKLTLQPSEFLKITFIIYLAAWLSSRGAKPRSRIWTCSANENLSKFHYGVKEKLKNSRKIFNQTFIAFLGLILIIALLLLLQPNFSTLGIIILTGILMYFLSNTPLWQISLIILLGGASLIPLLKIVPYRAERLLIFLNPELDPMGKGYQLKQALIAVGSGGIFGLGLGMSQQKFGFLPQTFSDSVFAIFSEETGFIGGLVLILLFMVFFWRGFKIGLNSKNKFSQILAFGITFYIVIQAFVNIGSMLGIVPVTGIPLPFIGYGGSHLIAELIGVGILLNVSKQNT